MRMVVLQSNCLGIKEEKDRICEKKMGKVDSVDDGVAKVDSSSDLESARSVGRDDDLKQAPKNISPPASSTMTTSAADSSNNRYWMKDLYNYSYARGFSASGLYSLAWAQAVQNKPLNEVLGEFQPDDGEEQRGGASGSNELSPAAAADSITRNNNLDNINDDDAVDDEREEGELEEGEIDLDSELAQVGDKGGSQRGRFGNNEDEEELEDRVPLIRKVLDNVNSTEAVKSFDVVCARLRGSVESLQQLALHCWFPSKDALIEQSFMGFKCVNSVFCAMNQKQREQNKSAMTRLLTSVMGLQPALFSPEQMKEIKTMTVLTGLDGSQRSKVGDKQEELPVTEKAILTDSNALVVSIDGFKSESFKKIEQDPSASSLDINEGGSKEVEFYSSDKKGTNKSDAVRLLNLPSVKTKMGIAPLLDLHGTHHSDNLPSPTHKHPSQDPVNQMLPVGNPVHPYEKDALKAVTSYQQKFFRRTFLSNDRLPSPTPSEEGKDGEVDNGNEEVSSYSAIPSVRQSGSLPQVDSSTAITSNLTMQRQVSTTSGLLGPISQPTAKSRDPRLRFMKPDVNALDTPPMKKQKNGHEGTGYGTTGLLNSDFVGQLESRSQLGVSVSDPWKTDNIAASGSVPTPMTAGTSITLQSVLRDIAGNPAAWMNIFEEQCKSSEPSKAALSLTNSSATHQLSITPAKSTVMAQQTVGLAQFPSSVTQMNPQDKTEKVRMKPRDPRRVLHTSSTEMSGNSGSEPTNTDPAVTKVKLVVKDSLDSQKHVKGSNTSALPSCPTTLPDITRQFTKNLKNIAEIMSVSRAPVIQSLNSLGPSDGGPACLDANFSSGSPLTYGNKQDEPGKPEEGASGPARSWTTWRDVEHLFDGYDEQQKVTIQKERARRVEEQKKMFASKKLCLVLDLDHTLLNSAKFSEVDPVHNEILRKKEEQDREKPYKHMFCFPHMGMWTKLRPGIWNFLEKASKLFELHLYTMGNKLYATEMAKVLDPKGVLFAGRVVSRGDDGDPLDGDERVPKSKDLEGVLGMESAVVIIDDSIKVWPHNKLNLIVVERYIYFPCSRRQFGLPGPSLLEIDHDERAEDGTLASSLAVIERIHRNFFSHERLDDVDVRNILAFEQRKILGGCRIVFSRVFPVGEVNPHLHPLWQTAEQFGAVCTNQIDEQVTHVVANSLGTDKVNWALSKGRFVVHPGWVEASALLYRRANELDFAIKS